MEAGSFEQLRPENVSLHSVRVGMRVFHIGDFTEEKLNRFRQQVGALRQLQEKWNVSLSADAPMVVVITNDDLAPEGKEVLDQSGLRVTFARSQKAKRRVVLGRLLVKRVESKAKGDFSYADMLNALEGEFHEERVFTSSDLARDPDSLLRHMRAMKMVSDRYQSVRPGGLAIVGALVPGTHDPAFIQAVVAGEQSLDLRNVSRAFPNNALSLVPASARFLGITDNLLAGVITVDDKELPIGGNEDFLYGFLAMLYQNQDCVLVVDFSETGERQGEIVGDSSKYVRRQAVYRAYAQRAIRQAVKRGKIPGVARDNEVSEESIEKIIEHVLDQHLFFAQINLAGQPEVLLTTRQREKGIRAPF